MPWRGFERQRAQSVCKHRRLNLINWHRVDNGDSTNQFAQIQVGLPVETQKLDWILWFARAGRDRIRIKEIANVKLGDKRHHKPDVGTKEGIANGEIREFVVDIAVEDDKVSAGAKCSTHCGPR